MTAQEVFDTAAIGILRQGCKSIGEDSKCLYRGLLNDLQAVHDGSKPHEWTAGLRNVAGENGLSAAVVDQWEKENGGAQ